MSQRAIRAIDKGVVHKICSGLRNLQLQLTCTSLYSGQVVLDVSTAVKELIENALDAGGDRVDVRIVDSGTILVRVCNTSL